MSIELNIEVPRNGDYFGGWQLTDLEGLPLDLTGSTLNLQVRSAAGVGGLPLARAFFSDREDTDGFFNILIHGAHLSAVEGSLEIVRLAYDFRVTDPDGVKIVETRGQIILMPGVTT